MGWEEAVAPGCTQAWPPSSLNRSTLSVGHSICVQREQGLAALPPLHSSGVGMHLPGLSSRKRHVFSPQVLASTSLKLAACVHPTGQAHRPHPRGVGIVEQGHSRLLMGQGVCVTEREAGIEGVLIF